MYSISEVNCTLMFCLIVILMNYILGVIEEDEITFSSFLLSVCFYLLFHTFLYIAFVFKGNNPKKEETLITDTVYIDLRKRCNCR